MADVDAPEACDCCRIVEGLAESDLHPVGRHWTLNANVDAHRPSLVLQSRTHRPALSSLSVEAGAELGPLMAEVQGRLSNEVGATRVYVLYLNESQPSHAHLHFVPRFEGEQLSDPKHLINAPPPEEVQIPAKSGVAARVARGLGAADEPSWLVNTTIAVLSELESLSAYRWVFKLRPLSRLTRTGRAEFYVTAWVILLALLLGLGSLHIAAAVFAAVVASYRLMDLVAMHLITLLERSRQRLASFQRSFLLAFLNVGELALIVSIYVQAASRRPVSESLLYGFDVVTLRGPSNQPGWVLDIIGVVGTSAAVLILTAVVSLVVGLISQSYIETGD